MDFSMHFFVKECRISFARAKERTRHFFSLVGKEVAKEKHGKGEGHKGVPLPLCNPHPVQP